MSAKLSGGADPFATLLGTTRGVGDEPRRPRPRPTLDGYAQFAFIPVALDARVRAGVEGELPLPYRITDSTSLEDAEWQALQEDVRTTPRLGQPFGVGGTTIPASLLRELEDGEEYTEAERALYEDGQFWDCALLQGPGEHDRILLARDPQSHMHLVGWPCPSPAADPRPWVTLDPEMIGRCSEGYTDTDAESVLAELSEALGLKIVCTWDRYKEGWCDGDSEWLVQVGDELVDLPVRVWEILSDPDCRDTRVNTASVGTIPSWKMSDFVHVSSHNYVHKGGAGDLTGDLTGDYSGYGAEWDEDE